MNFQPDDFRSRELREAFDYWEAKRGVRAMPARQDIDPAEMVAWLSKVFLVEVIYPANSARPCDFRFRLVGTDVVARYGRDFTGRVLSDLDLEGRTDALRDEYGQAAIRAKPQYFLDCTYQANGRPLHYERLLMPLSNDGERPNMLLGVQAPLVAEAAYSSSPLSGAAAASSGGRAR
jgi:hypothetical protein